MNKKYWQKTNTVNAMPMRSYYIPHLKCENAFCMLPVSGAAYASLNGEWEFAAYKSVSEVPENIENAVASERMSVPSCVQYYGYDYFQYINCRYPFPCDPQRVPAENPAFHYRRAVDLSKAGGSVEYSATYISFHGRRGIYGITRSRQI